MTRAAVLLCKCTTHQQTFGIRIEQSANNAWHYTWAFPVSERVAKNEGYDRIETHGSLMPTESYPGCPFCGRRALVLCPCRKYACYAGEPNTTCPWCHRTSRVEIAESIDIIGGAF